MIAGIHRRNQVLVIALEGNLEVGHQTRFKEDLQKEIAPDIKKIVLSFEKVSFIDSACLGALVGVSRELRKKNGDLRLANLNDEVRSIFQLTRLDKVFPIFDGLDEAVASYAS